MYILNIRVRWERTRERMKPKQRAHNLFIAISMNFTEICFWLELVLCMLSEQNRMVGFCCRIFFLLSVMFLVPGRAYSSAHTQTQLYCIFGEYELFLFLSIYNKCHFISERIHKEYGLSLFTVDIVAIVAWASSPPLNSLCSCVICCCCCYFCYFLGKLLLIKNQSSLPLSQFNALHIEFRLDRLTCDFAKSQFLYEICLFH